MNYAVEQRLRFIDFLLYQYGHVNRIAIIDYFGIAPATATRDFVLYQQKAPTNMLYDPKTKTYRTTHVFKRAYT